MRKGIAGGSCHKYHHNDLGNGTRGIFYERFKAGTNLGLLSPDIAAVFENEETVNDALRSLIKLAKKSVRSEVSLYK